MLEYIKLQQVILGHFSKIDEHVPVDNHNGQLNGQHNGHNCLTEIGE